MMKIIIKESQFTRLVENQNYIDSILDKMSDKGYESLSIDEKKFLEFFSKQERIREKEKTHGEKNLNDEEKSILNLDLSPETISFKEEDPREGTSFESSFDNFPKITFIFDYEEKEDNQIHLYGTLYFDDMEYHGVIVTNKSQNLIDYDFIDANIDFTTRNVTNLMDDNYDKRGMFENFFENEVIPKLLSF
jgi:hypothetical protein